MAKTAIVLRGSDNVGIVTADVHPGSDVQIEDRTLSVKDAIPFGHKIALFKIAGGAEVIKFGVPIGRARTDIAPGEHVHIHNIESAYINNAVDNFED